ncbi:alpha/beta-hydrolase [Trichoderma citrinoviride]|uniref:Alpha/beta-hydrolase n=1 Tax=Trichoderma citrinoviride TaxID=58853 RepID=A0A2T4B995_9HYPO|nr:alpha/beta-hydrolase [Trichoderma citrinoviride]PTB65894.1 alpha/beta-hydrolase [Trichoderma citrinoviride]
MDTSPWTIEEILATGIMDPEFEAAWKANGSPPGRIPSDIPTFQKTIQATLPSAQQMLAASRPPNIIEREIDIPIDDTFSSRTIVCQAATPSTSPSPIVILVHGGGHCVGYPELELTTARELVLAHEATCILPSYRLAPEYPFPTDVNDIFVVARYIARKAAEQDGGGILPANADPKTAFIIGGLSAGAAISNDVAHLARDLCLEPPLTGLFLACGIFFDPDSVPDRYKEQYLSMEQNKSAPILDTASLKQYMSAYKGDKPLPLRNPSPVGQQPHSNTTTTATGRNFLPPVYFQVAGMDPARDDSLIYERMLREECGVPTRMDVYHGLPHGFWTQYPDLKASRKRMRDAVDGVGWLLGNK